MRRIKAYTLIELIVVMIVGSILVAFLWSGYVFVNRNYKKWTEQNQKVIGLVNFEHLFRTDIRNSTLMKEDHDFFILSGNDRNIEYQFLSNVIVRKTFDQIDTIDCKIDGYELTYIDTKQVEKKHIRTIDLTISMKDRKVSLSFYKDYDAKFLYNN